MKRLERPIGLYLLTFADLVFLGVLESLKFVRDTRYAEQKPSFIIVFVTLFLALFTAASAVWAFFGDNYGRYALLTFVTLNILWIYTDLVFFIMNEGFGSRSNIQYMIAAAKGIGGLGLNWWYLMSDEVVAYFDQRSQSG